jgi:hypothetical protein
VSARATFLGASLFIATMSVPLFFALVEPSARSWEAIVFGSFQSAASVMIVAVAMHERGGS